jgi:bacteriorhodopsin
MIFESGLYSLIIQVITSIIDVYGITLPLNDNHLILRDLLQVELGVQVIEMIFYIWLVFSLTSYKNITIFRYFDWFVTTPIMLITLMSYMKITPNNNMRLTDFFKSDKENIIYVVILNALMLIFGFVGEILPSYRFSLVLIGFIPFILYFYKIYKEYLIPNKGKEEVNSIFTRSRLFWYFLIIWSLYGLVSFLPYVKKNIGLNILDLFSKNVFGLMLVYIIASKSKIKE